MARSSVGLFGGSFNPPHLGHVLSIAYVLSAELVERVVAVPVFEHALGKNLAPFPERVAMARLAREYEQTCAAFGTSIDDLAHLVVRRAA